MSPTKDTPPADRAWFDARLLLWFLILVLATGIPLMFWFDADAATHRDALPGWGTVLRGLHAASTAWLTVGTALHLVSRLRRPSPRRAIRSGSITLIALGVAAATGAMVAQTGASERLLDWLGLRPYGEAAVTGVALFHIAITTLILLTVVYLHVAKWGLHHLVGSPRQATLALGLVAATTLVLGASTPGDGSRWSGATWIAVPPVAVVWGWAILLGLAVALMPQPIRR